MFHEVYQKNSYPWASTSAPDVPCDYFFRAEPKEIRWVVAHNYMSPNRLIQEFINKYPNSILIDHLFDKSGCSYCEEKFLVLMQNNGEFGTDK